MQAAVTITPSQLPDVLLHVATVRPVFVWGAPGIGKSALVEDFAASLGMDCVTLLGTQLAPEDLIGVPQLVTGPDGVTRSRFCPPETIARTEPYVLFLDELNASVPEVQKAFYNLVHDRRLGTYALPHGSVVVGAGNRQTDNALARPMASALVNRMWHVHLRASATDWLAWAAVSDIHPLVVDYVRNRPDHLWSAPPKTEEVFSTPRAWHVVSDVLHSYGDGIGEDTLRAVVFGALTPQHASSFCAYVKRVRHAWDLEAILSGDLAWPRDPRDRDLLFFLAESLRARLVKDLPASRTHVSGASRLLAHRAKALLVELADISLECAQVVVADGEDGPVLPAWFALEVVRDLPRLTQART